MMLFAATFLILSTTIAHGFVVNPSTYSHSFIARFGSNHYDDFDFVIGDEPDDRPPPDSLQQLLEKAKQEDVRKDAQLAKNWKTGNWKVRGFSLDKYNGATQENNDETPTKDSTEETVNVSKVHTSLTPNQVIVGRTDGSICFVTLGTQYLTQFVAKLAAKESTNNTISIETELVPSEIMGLSERRGQEETPFEVERQFMAHDASIIAMATAENENHDELLFTAAQGSGEIRVWVVPEEPDAKVIPLRTLSGVHADTVVALKTLSLSPDDQNDNNLLFTAGKDGSIALWEIQTGDLVFQCQTVHDQEPCSVLCADVDQSRSIVYLGTVTGHVVGYSVAEMVECAGEGGTCPVPSGRFLAYEGGVTAVTCAGEGTLARSNPGASSSILLTGGSDGIVKQWEIMFRKMESTTSPDEPSLKLEHWPRMANQRMQRRAHLFKGHDDEFPITALASVDASKFLSAGADGTVRAWSPSTGEELFRMDGFTEELSSLCLQDDLYLVTDGMENYVCVHDFDVESSTTELGDGYELEW